MIKNQKRTILKIIRFLGKLVLLGLYKHGVYTTNIHGLLFLKLTCCVNEV